MNRQVSVTNQSELPMKWIIFEGDNKCLYLKILAGFEVKWNSNKKYSSPCSSC